MPLPARGRLRQALSAQRRAFVTGGSGFVGRHLVARLRAEGWDVLCATRAGSRTAALSALGALVVPADLARPETYAAALEGVEVAFHAAAVLRVPWRRSFLEANARLSRGVAAACAAQSAPVTLVHVSSLAAIGPARGAPLTEGSPARPISLYGKSKLAAERALEAWAGRLSISIVRPPMVFGEHDARSVGLYRMARRGWLPVPHDAEQRISMIHGADLAALLLQVAEQGERRSAAGPAAGVYHAAHPAPPTAGEFAQLLGAATGVARVRPLRVPRALLWTSMAAGEVVARVRDQPSVLNLDKAREATGGAWVCATDKITALGFVPEATLAERIAQTAAWYRAQGLL
ncbi:MAG: NAD-dependent epimerase/dehydratase family protein [Planctomycetes bacterium]|nr:NAD-dependent epimerase/dehydratase family protein [Planctomycetota bacterium]